MKKLQLLILLVTIGLACTTSPPEPEIEQPEIESEPIPFLIDTLLLDNGAYCNIETPLIYEDNLIVMITNWETKEGWINCYDKTTLELKWHWQEALDEFGAPAKGFGSVSHIYDGVLSLSLIHISEPTRPY